MLTTWKMLRDTNFRSKRLFQVFHQKVLIYLSFPRSIPYNARYLILTLPSLSFYAENREYKELFLLGWLLPMVSTGKIRPHLPFNKMGVMLLVWRSGDGSAISKRGECVYNCEVLKLSPMGGGGHCLFEGRYPLPHYRPHTKMSR